MKFFLIQLRNLLKLLAHLSTGNHCNCHKMHRMLSFFTKFITEFESTWWAIILRLLFCWRQREDQWIIFTLPSTNILKFLFTTIPFYHIRAMVCAKNALLIHCRTGQEYRQKWYVWSLISFPISRHEFLAVNFKAHKNFVLVIKNS